MAQSKKITTEQLIKKKLERDTQKNATKEIYIDALDGYVTVSNPSDSQRIEFADKTKTGNYADMLDAYSRLIYDCCPALHDKTLQEEIEVDYPYDTVKAIFSIDEIADIGVKVLNFFDEETEDADENLKN